MLSIKKEGEARRSIFFDKFTENKLWGKVSLLFPRDEKTFDVCLVLFVVSIFVVASDENDDRRTNKKITATNHEMTPEVTTLWCSCCNTPQLLPYPVIVNSFLTTTSALSPIASQSSTCNSSSS